MYFLDDDVKKMIESAAKSPAFDPRLVDRIMPDGLNPAREVIEVKVPDAADLPGPDDVVN